MGVAAAVAVEGLRNRGSKGLLKESMQCVLSGRFSESA